MRYSSRSLMTPLTVVSMALAAPGAVGGQAVMTFVPIACTTGQYSLPGSSYTEAGFTLTAPLPGFGTWCADAVNYAGPGMWIRADQGEGNIAALTKNAGGTFSINAIELAHQQPASDAQSFTFTGNLLGGGTVTQTFTIGAQAGGPTFTPFLFDATWTNLVSVDFAPQVYSFYQFTNIVLDAPVSTIPEPASMILLGTGLVGVFVAVRRRRKKSPQA